MKRTFSICFLSLLFLLPATTWAQQEEGGQPGQINASPTGGGRGLTLLPEYRDSSSIRETIVAEKAPMFPDSLMKNYEVEVFQGVIKMADWVGFKYMEVLGQAKSGDVSAIYQILDFNRYLEGKDGTNHGVTCLELIPLAGDDAFAAAVSACKPKMIEIVLERIKLAQGRTKKAFLREGMEQWAPFTWAFLNGQPAPEREKPTATSSNAAPSIQSAPVTNGRQ